MQCIAPVSTCGVYHPYSLAFAPGILETPPRRAGTGDKVVAEV